MKKSNHSVSPTVTPEIISPELQANRDKLKRLVAMSPEELMEDMKTWPPGAVERAAKRLVALLEGKPASRRSRQ